MSGARHVTRSELAAFRSRNYWFLAQFYLRRPEPEFLGELSSALASSTDDTEASETLSLLRDELNRVQNDETAALELEKEYARLFRGLREGYGPPPPYESVYRENRLVGATTAAVMHHYRRAGFGEIDETAGPQDHLGAELKFMSLLCYREHEAWTSGDTHQARKSIERQQEFLEHHLMAWLPEYGELIAGESRVPFYSAAARLTLETLEPERSLLDGIADDEPDAA